jgi:hypothetical protein
MNRSSSSRVSLSGFAALLLALFLLAAPAAASPPAPEREVVAEPAPAGLFNIRPTHNRTRVVQVAALGMALALFIIMRATK